MNSDLASEDFLVKFWCQETRFPSIKKIAQWILAIPASSASDERVFSSTGFTMNHRRAEIGGGVLSDLTFIHYNHEC